MHIYIYIYIYNIYIYKAYCLNKCLLSKWLYKKWRTWTQLCRVNVAGFKNPKSAQATIIAWTNCLCPITSG